MIRHTFALKVKKSHLHSFRTTLGSIWLKLTSLLDEAGITNFSLWNCDLFVFGYGESETDAGEMGWNKVETLLDEHTAAFINWISVPGQPMRLMYENCGIVREKKELIRHRMFMTHLKTGCAEEYKKRHDQLTVSRTQQPDPGPDSNFTIWNAGEYIFGYDEIDITMESDETPEIHAQTVAWETRQLEIMDWITNDVDWLTGEHHPACVRIGWHG